LAVRNNLFLAIVYLLIIPLLRGISNLDMVRSAECLEQAVILTGIFLIAPLPAPEQSMAIQDVVCTKKIPHWKILLLRFIMSMLLLIMMVCLFSGIMVWKNCIFPFMPYVAGTVISAMALGSFGFAAAIFSNSVIVGYLASIGYFLLNSLGNVSEDSIFYLFSNARSNVDLLRPLNLQRFSNVICSAKCSDINMQAFSISSPHSGILFRKGCPYC